MRPAKSIERKMLAESFRRLHPFQRINEYRYIGFGSIYISPKIPPGTHGKDLRGQGVASAFHRTILNEVDEQLSRRNSMLETGDRMQRRQIAHFLYQDGAL